MNKKIKICQRKLLHDNYVFIDGISKSGKIVISSIISSFQNCENQIFPHKFNDYLKFSNLNLMDERLAIEVILQDMQILMIENQLSRFLNFRKHDLSSVNNSLQKKKYYENLKIKDNPAEIKKIINELKKRKNFIPMVVDDFFPNCFGRFKYFFKFKKIILLRNPFGILYENLIRNRIDKQIKLHPWQKSFHYIKNNTNIPWFVEPENFRKYMKSSRIEKYLMYMKSDYSPYLKNRIFNLKKSKFVFIEDVWREPNKMTENISKFLNTSKSKYTDVLLKKLYLPRLGIKENYEKEFYFIKKKLNKKEFDFILKLEKEYKNKKNLYGTI